MVIERRRGRHGLLLTAHQVIRAKLPARVTAHAFYRSRWLAVLSCAVTFVFVAVGWVPFMMPWSRALLALMFGFGS